MTFTASVSGSDTPVEPTYKWTIYAGEITGGQGTYSITVDASEVGGQTVTATVEVGGYPNECTNTASCATRVIRDPLALKVGEYGDINFRDEKARLANFAIELENNPSAQGYVIVYGGRRGRPSEAQRRADRARNLLVPKRGPSRIVTIDGGFREKLTVELWLVPSGVSPPSAAPTVDSSEVQIRGGKVKRRKRVIN